jgi:hypothetical protein
MNAFARERSISSLFGVKPSSVSPSVVRLKVKEGHSEYWAAHHVLQNRSWISSLEIRWPRTGENVF